MFMDSEDLARVQWRGHWSQLKTLEYYIQEVGAQTILAKLPSSAHSKVKILSEHSTSLLLDFLSVA